MGLFDSLDEDFLDEEALQNDSKKKNNKKPEGEGDDNNDAGGTPNDECGTPKNEGDDDLDLDDDDDDDTCEKCGHKKGSKACDDECGDDDDDDDKKKKKKGKKDKKDDDDDDDDKDDDDIKDEEVIDSFILNEAAIDDLITLQESDQHKVNFDRERKVRWITKEQKLKRLTYKISILMAKKNNDADYRRWAKGRAIVVAARKKIMLKYKSRALGRARQVIAAYRAGKFSGLLQNNKRDVAPLTKGFAKT